MNTNLHKKPDLQTVKMAATALILAEGSTTTLEVKNHLRKKGYSVFQSDLSIQMRFIAQNEGWYTYDNGMFIIYSFPQLGIIPQ